MNEHASVFLHLQDSVRRLVVIADFCPDAQLFAGFHSGNGKEVHIPAQHSVMEEGGFVGQNDLVPGGIDLLDIDRPAHGNPQSLSLPDRIVGDSLVGAQTVSILVHKVSLPGDGAVSFASVFLDKVSVMTVGHEADLLGIGLLSHRQLRLKGDPADLILGVVTQRHQSPLQLFLGELVEHIGLILRRVNCSFYGKASVGQMHNMGVVTGGNQVRLHDLRGV